MPRAMWRGAIQFGLVTVPVKLYLATESRGGLSFNLLHKECLNRIQMKTHCPDARRDPAQRHRARLRVQQGPVRRHRARRTSSRSRSRPSASIEIELFVDADREVAGDELRQAGLLPRARGDRPQGVLPAQVGSGRRGPLGDLQDRAQGSRGAGGINPYANTMLLSTLYWPDEIRSTAELDLPEEDFDFKPAEKQMAAPARRRPCSGDFEADQYKDDYRQALMAVIEAKVEGKPTEKTERRRSADQDRRPDERARGERRRCARRQVEARIGRQRPRPPRRRQPRPRSRRRWPTSPAARSGRGPRHRRRSSVCSAQGRTTAQDGLTILKQQASTDNEQLPLHFETGARQALPTRLRPMVPLRGESPFDDADWFFEPWWPGTPALAYVEDFKRPTADRAPGRPDGGVSGAGVDRRPVRR